MRRSSNDGKIVLLAVVGCVCLESWTPEHITASEGVTRITLGKPRKSQQPLV